MDKKVINEEQFRKLVLNEAKKVMAEGDSSPKKEETSKTKKFSFDKVEGLIGEMETMNKSITSIIEESSDDADKEIVEEGKLGLEQNWSPNQNRDLDPIEHNKKKNVLHMNEGEKEKWKRMMGYEIPDDEKR